jgi:hypothetical protein
MEFLKRLIILFIGVLTVITSFSLFSSGTYHPPSYEYGVREFSAEEIAQNPGDYFHSRFQRLGILKLSSRYQDKTDFSILYTYQTILERRGFELKKMNVESYKKLILRSRKKAHQLIGITDYKIISAKESCRSTKELCFEIEISYRGMTGTLKRKYEHHYFTPSNYVYQKVRFRGGQSNEPTKLFAMMNGLKKGGSL